jgi:uncharacterized protein (DUF362 family)
MAPRHPPTEPRDPGRRDFLVRLGKAAGGLALTGLAAPLALRAPGWPSGRAEAGAGLERIFDFRHPTAGTALAMGRGSDRAASLDAALAAIGGLERFLSKGDRVLLKVNAGFATAPELGATTHPALLGALARRCLQAGAAEVLVSDNPVADTLSCFGVSGLTAASREAGAKLLLPEPDAFATVTLPGGELLRAWPVLASPLLQATRLINVCPVKHHSIAGATMGLKNSYGLLGGSRGTFHQDVHGVIGELGQLFRPTLTVLDATWVMVRNGPTGGSLSDLEARDTIVVGTDAVAVDACGAGLLGLEPADLTYLLRAAAAGLGSLDWRGQLSGSP